jgi:hypothetical protein
LSRASTSSTIQESSSEAQHTTGAALAAGPDVWEIVARLQDLDGSEEQRIALLRAESDIHPRLIRIALDYAADHAAEIRARIDRNRAMAERSRSTSEQREALLA